MSDNKVEKSKTQSAGTSPTHEVANKEQAVWGLAASEILHHNVWSSVSKGLKKAPGVWGDRNKRWQDRGGNIWGTNL